MPGFVRRLLEAGILAGSTVVVYQTVHTGDYSIASIFRLTLLAVGLWLVF